MRRTGDLTPEELAARRAVGRAASKARRIKLRAAGRHEQREWKASVKRRAHEAAVEAIRVEAATKRQLKREPPNEVSEPTVTPERAHLFVKLLAAGVPSERALQYCDPRYARQIAEQPAKLLAWHRRWTTDPLVTACAAGLHGGAWEDLDKTQRLQVALDKHLAELAYLLYTSAYSTLEGAELKKVDEARKALMEWLDTGEEAGDGQWKRFVEDLLGGKVEVTGAAVLPAPGAMPVRES